LLSSVLLVLSIFSVWIGATSNSIFSWIRIGVINGFSLLVYFAPNNFIAAVEQPYVTDCVSSGVSVAGRALDHHVVAMGTLARVLSVPVIFSQGQWNQVCAFAIFPNNFVTYIGKDGQLVAP
jgi:hypothetical protein